MGSLTGLFGNRVATRRRLNLFWALKLSKMLQLDARFWESRRSASIVDNQETRDPADVVEIDMTSGCHTDYLSRLTGPYPFTKQNVSKSRI
jgi:hypothetical protein